MTLALNEDKFPLILKECFLFYSFKIDNCIYTQLGEKTYKFNYTENTSLYNFASFLKKTHIEYLNIDWLFEYFNYQFTYWDFIKNQKIKENPNYLINLHWIVGQKALKRYLSKTKKDTYFYNSVFFPKYEIRKQDLINYLNLKKFIIEKEDTILEEDKIVVINPLNEKEEFLKKKRYNTDEGFFICLNFTTLFKFNSNLCLGCIFKQKCKSVLKQKYPNLYQKRFINKIILQRQKLEEDGNNEESKLPRTNIRRNKKKFKVSRK